MEDCTNQEIADRIGLAEKTIRNYFTSDEIEQFKRFYSDQELFRLQQAIEKDLSDAESIAKEALGEAKRQAKDSSDYRQVAEAALKIRQRKVDLLQELGIIDKPGDVDDGRQNGNTDGQSVREELAEIYKKQQEQDSKEKETVEAES